MKKYYSLLLVLVASLLWFMLHTRPDTVVIGMLVVPFILIFLIASLIAFIIVKLMHHGKPSVGLVTFALFIGAITALIAGLNSVGSILPREIAIMSLFFGVFIFYVYKRRL